MSNVPSKTIFQARKREASFWGKNFTRAWKNGKPIRVKFARNLSETINVRFDSRTMNVLRDQAQRKGLGTTQLIRMWIVEKLQNGGFPQANTA